MIKADSGFHNSGTVDQILAGFWCAEEDKSGTKNSLRS